MKISIKPGEPLNRRNLKWRRDMGRAYGTHWLFM
jgi:hypothetical protein